MTQDIIQRRGDRLIVTAPMTQRNVKALLAAGEASFEARLHVVDLAAVPQADSSALAVLFAWVRAAEARGRQLRFTNLPTSMAALADLYGVRQTLPML